LFVGKTNRAFNKDALRQVINALGFQFAPTFCTTAWVIAPAYPSSTKLLWMYASTSGLPLTRCLQV
jgi:hypothetical protein